MSDLDDYHRRYRDGLRSAYEEAARRSKLAELERVIAAAAERETSRLYCNCLLNDSGLEGKAVAAPGGDKFIADEVIFKDGVAHLTGQYINKKGRVSSSWTVTCLLSEGKPVEPLAPVHKSL